MPIFNPNGIPQCMVAENIIAKIRSLPIVHTNSLQHFWCSGLKIISLYIIQLSETCICPHIFPNPYILFAHENKSKFLDMGFTGP